MALSRIEKRHFDLAMLLAASVFMAVTGCTPSFYADLDTAMGYRLVWPSPPERPRIEFLWSLYSFLPPGERIEYYIEETGALGANPYDLPYMLRPNSLCLAGNDRLYIVDQGIPRVTAVDLKNNEVRHFGTAGDGALYMPIGVATDFSGNVYVTDSEAKRVNRYSGDGVFTGIFGAEGVLQRPTGITFNKLNGRIYVVDTLMHRICVFDINGSMLYTFGTRGDKDGEFNYPTYIASGIDGKIYVTDELNFRIQIFDGEGRFLGKFGRHGDSYSDIEKPKGIAVDTFGNIYVVDALQDRIKIFDGSGRLLLFWGGNGRNPGQFYMPIGISIDSQNRIFVADTYNMRVQAFRLMDSERL